MEEGIEPNNNVESGFGGLDVGMSGFEQTGHFDEGLDNLDWLNSVDWSRGPWINLDGLA